MSWRLKTIILTNNIFPVYPPPVSDCSEIYRLGFKLPGPYWIDPTGDIVTTNSSSLKGDNKLERFVDEIFQG